MRDLRGDSLLYLPLPFLKGKLEPLHGNFTVLCLGTALGGVDDNTGWEVAEPYRRIGHVAVLSAGTGAPVEFKPDIRFLYVNGHGLGLSLRCRFVIWWQKV